MNKYHIIFLIGLIGCAEEVTVIKNDPPPIIVLPPEEEQFPEVCESQQCTEDSQCSPGDHRGCVQVQCLEGFCKARYVVEISMNDENHYCYEDHPQQYPETCEVKWCIDLEDCPPVACRLPVSCLEVGSCMYADKGSCP
jgi:hypothetical protein